MRKEKKHHYIYKTTCKVTGRYYLGMHSTDNLEDGYIGSGKQLWYSIRKHGKETHERDILEFLPNRSSLKIREKEIINEEILKDPMCMNIALGGEGGKLLEINGFYGKSHTADTKTKISKSKKGQGSGNTNSQFNTTWITKDCINKKIQKSDVDEYILKGWKKGLHVSQETKDKLSAKAKDDWNKRKMNHSGL
jgi:hypothetical protein